jgi:hypothetical protein
VLTSTVQDYAPADVWSLAKTLWVLACDQRWPPPGPHRRDEPATRLDAYVQHARTPISIACSRQPPRLIHARA